MASIRKRGNSYYIDYQTGGKRVRKNVGPSLEQAQKELANIKSGLASHKSVVVNGNFPLNQLFLRFSEYCLSNLAKRTQVRYKAIVDHLQFFLQESFPQLTQISELNPDHFENYKRHRQGERASIRTINAELIVLKKAFRLAVKWQMVSRNPLEEVAKISVARKDRPRLLTIDECQRIVANCDKYLYPIIFTFLNTGMRKGELENLHWLNVDLEKRIIHIVPEPGFVPDSARRDIPINEKLFDVLVKQKEITGNADYVFLDNQERKIPENYLRKRFIPLTQKCGLGEVTQIQSLRYTFGAQLVVKGLDLVSVKKIMGHSEKDTVFIYGHLVKPQTIDFMNKLEF